MSTTECVFCAIVAGTSAAQVLCADDETLTFVDIDRQAPVHLLVIPREHVPTLVELAARPRLAAAMLTAVAVAANHAGIGDFRTVFNTGVGGGQHVWHVHAHVLGGRQMTWPPG